MHFNVLYLMKNKEEVSKEEVEQSFGDKYCYACGEREADICDYCDWFQIGGRWNGFLKAKRGEKGDLSWCNANEKEEIAIANINDLEGELDKNCIYAVADNDGIYESGT